jgi:hypothetical protein
MEQRVLQWCEEHGAELLQPYQSALRPLQLRCRACGLERTERCALLVEQPRCPGCPVWQVDRPGWVVEQPFLMEDTLVFACGIDVAGTAVVIDVCPTAERQAHVERVGFRYVAADRDASVDTVVQLCEAAAAEASAKTTAYPSPVVPSVVSGDAETAVAATPPPECFLKTEHAVNASEPGEVDSSSHPTPIDEIPLPTPIDEIPLPVPLLPQDEFYVVPGARISGEVEQPPESVAEGGAISDNLRL